MLLQNRHIAAGVTVRIERDASRLFSFSIDELVLPQGAQVAPIVPNQMHMWCKTWTTPGIQSV